MHSDLTKLRQILLNLISIAAKFTEADSGGDQVAFTVADTELGMTAEQVGRLFQRFQQADSSTTRDFDK